MRDPREVLTRAASPPRLTVRYGSHSDHLADVWLPSAPEGAAPPLVVFVHGGFWRAEWDRMHSRPLCNALAEAGYAVAAIEYRRVGQPGGGWPGSFDDMALALDTVPSLLADEGVRFGPVVLSGHSAGGHFVLWAASRHRLPESALWRRDTPAPIAGVLALAPVCDLAAAYRDGLGGGAAGELLGGGPDAFPERYAAADPSALPLPEVPTALVHGTADDRVPITQSEQYAARTPDVPSGVTPTLVAIPDADHFAVIDPLSPAWPPTLAALADLTK
ncbi:MAG: alpha/beta hydrolase family protein [Micromonosporaceae bacterium]